MIRGARVTGGGRAPVTADKKNDPLHMRSSANVGAGPIVHRLVLTHQIQQKTETHEAEIFRTKFLPLAEGYEIWFLKKEKDRSQGKLFDSFVKLSTTLY